MPVLSQETPNSSEISPYDAAMEARKAAGIAALVATALAAAQGLVGLGVATQDDTFQWNGWFAGGAAFAVIALASGVWLLATTGKRRITNPDADLDVETLEPDRVPNWDNDWRISLRVWNVGVTGEFSAYLLAPVRGVASRNYGDINLQWDTVNTPFSTLVGGKPERLHLARISSRRRTIRFLSPGQTADQPREFQQAELKLTESPLTASIVFNTRDGRCQRRTLDIHLDHENEPTVRLGGPEAC